jgi:ferredoxin
MMGMSAAAKNVFGIVPGTFKPEYHFRYPKHEDFAAMILDLNTFISPKLRLCIADAVVGMEGNGPTQGKPRKIGALLASASPHALDLAAASLIGLGVSDVPTLQAAYARQLIPATAEELEIVGSLSAHAVPDFENIHVRRSLQFEGHGKFAAMFVRSALRAEPRVKKNLCIGCKKCAEICPAHAIVMKNKTPVIDRNTCITCFCCQEFCPVGAMKVHRPLIARIVNHTKK